MQLYYNSITDYTELPLCEQLKKHNDLIDKCNKEALVILRTRKLNKLINENDINNRW